MKKKQKNKQHFWHILQFYFMKFKNLAQTEKNICIVYGDDTVND